MEDLERPRRALNTMDVEAQRTGADGIRRHRLRRAVLIVAALLLALAVLLATGVIER